MEPSEPVRAQSFWHKPIEILLFGAFSLIFGLLLAIAGAVIGSQASQSSNGGVSALVVLAGVGMLVSGVGFMAGKPWGFVSSIIVFSIAYVASIVQAFQRLYAWGIFLDPIVLSFLVLPRVRSYFLKSQALAEVISQESTGSIDTILGQQSAKSQSPARKNSFVQELRKPSNILTLILIIAIFTPVPVVAASVHAVSVTQVTLNILYPPGSSETNITSIWFGFSPKTISAGYFTWGTGRMGLQFSLTNLGLFEQHTVDWIRVVTPGFTLYSVGLPVTVPDLAVVQFHLVLQSPDYDFYGPLVLELHTT